MNFGVPSRDRQLAGTIYGCGYVALYDDRLRILRDRGDAVPVANDMLVEQVHAYSLPEFDKLVEGWRRVARDAGLQCLFRGQARDYFSDGFLQVLPAAERSTGIGTPFNGMTNSADVIQQVVPWLETLAEELDVDVGDCLRYIPFERDSDYGILRILNPSVFAGRYPSEALVGIMQHYGFPTYCLDVTLSSDVALWFALHPVSRTPSGEIVHGDSVERTASSVYVYLQPSMSVHWPVIDLTRIAELVRVAHRPIAQQGCLLPYRITHLDQPSDGIRVIDTPAPRCPTVIIKLHFSSAELAQRQADISTESLLPLHDQLYLAFIGRNVPHVARYAGTSDAPPVPRRRPRRRARRRGSRADVIVPGAVAENPRATDAFFRIMDLLNTSGLGTGAGSVSRSDVIFTIKDDATISEDLRQSISNIADWASVAVYFRRESDRDDW